MTQKIQSIDVSRKVGATRAASEIGESVQQLHTRFRMYGRNAREWMRKCVLMLPALERERVWEKKGFGSLAEYAGRLSGMSHETVSDGLRILHAVEGMPDIMRVIEQRGINCVKPIVTLLTPENQQFWAEKVRVMSQHTLQMYRKELVSLIGKGPTNESTTLDIIFRGAPSDIIILPQQQAIRITDTCTNVSVINPSPSSKIFAISLNPEIIEQLEKLNGKDGDWNNLMEEFLALRAQKLEQEKPKEKQTDSRHIPAAIERFVIARSRGVCEVGACAKRYTILHHIQRFAAEKTHDPSRIIALCTSHERLVHLGLIEDEYIRPRQWKIMKKADKNDRKYAIDQMVQKYRRPG